MEEIDPQETREAVIKANKEYPEGLRFVVEFGKEILRGNAIFHAAYAAEKISKESVQRVVTDYFARFQLEAADIAHATECDKKYGPERTEAVLEMGYRRKDIPCAADALGLWPNVKDAVTHLTSMNKMLKKVRCDLHEEDIRYAAITWKNLDPELLERALRERHPKNERECWLRGASIPIIAHCYKLSAPHTGPAIDQVRSRGSRREKIGLEVLGIIGRKFNRTLKPPPWLK